MLTVQRRMIDPQSARGPHEIDAAKVQRYAAAMAHGATFPPVRVVDYGDGNITIIDGHHRCAAAAWARLQVDALIADGEAFEDLDCEVRCTGERADDERFWPMTARDAA